MTPVEGIALSLQLINAGMKIAEMVKQAQEEERDLTPAEMALIKSQNDLAYQNLDNALKSKLDN